MLSLECFLQTPSFYSLMSRTPLPEVPQEDPNNKSVRLPYHPDFIYAAFKSEDGSSDTTLTIFNSAPKALEGHIHILHVSSKKVIL